MFVRTYVPPSRPILRALSSAVEGCFIGGAKLRLYEALFGQTPRLEISQFQRLIKKIIIITLNFLRRGFKKSVESEYEICFGQTLAKKLK